MGHALKNSMVLQTTSTTAVASYKGGTDVRQWDVKDHLAKTEELFLKYKFDLSAECLTHSMSSLQNLKGLVWEELSLR